MPSEPNDFPDEPPAAEDLPDREPGWSRWKIALLGLVALLGIALAATWLSREKIAENLIASELKKHGIPATYRIEKIGAREQVLADLVIGDPRKPDFIAERVIVSIRLRFGTPDIGMVRMVRPRLYGTFRKGKLSFGALDPLIFTNSKEPFRLPDMRLAIEDGRGRIESDHGALGIKLEGNGNLRGGFAGSLAAITADMKLGDCATDKLTLFGKVSVSGERPKFEGPARMSRLACPDTGLRLADGALAINVTGDAGFDGAEGNASLQSGALAIGDYRIGRTSGTTRFAWRKKAFTAQYDLAGNAIESPQLRMPDLALAGRARAFGGFSRVDVEGEAKGSVTALGAPFERAMDDLANGGEGTFIAPLARKAGFALRREARGATFALSLTARRTPDGDNLVMPVGSLRGQSGQAIASLSRFQLRAGRGGVQIVAGNFSTGGPGLPRVSGQVRRSGEGYRLDLAMDEYTSGDARLTLPKLVVLQKRGSLGFAGELRLSGALPGGHADNLVLPVEGNWSQAAGFSAWRSCTNVRFDQLRLVSLHLAARSLSFCPPRGGAIVRSGRDGLKIAAGVPSLDLSGKLGKTPIRIASGPAGLAWPGNLAARAIDVSLGSRNAVSKFHVDQLAARLGSEIEGTFGGGKVALDAVPLDLSELSGRWRYASGALTLSEGSLLVSDREQVDRFEPLVATGATLRLVNNRITANALLREPTSQREVLRADIRHDLGTGRGDADLIVDALVFDQSVQPDTLSPLALGVIANAEGVVRGAGRFEWNEASVASYGKFSTDSFNFAAAFGPVAGASGTIEFTDLLGLVTAPDQTLKVASINPGIEVNDGLVTYALLPGRVLQVKGARWPFLEGELSLRPVDIPIGLDGPVRYVLVIDGIDAARFVQHLELGNLAATGTFDGRLPLTFDQDGGRIESGRLTSREPGGNLSYVGELTYKDLSPMANFAFAALRSINYKHMAIQLDGPLDGEIVTRVNFDGISQGESASRNFVTRSIAKLPIQFRLNIRAPFMQLVSSMRSLYDPEYIRDPRLLGIMEGTSVPPAPDRAGKPDVQPPESDGMP